MNSKFEVAMIKEGMVCPICGAGPLRMVIGQEEYEYKGVKITFDGFKSYRCDCCGEDLLNSSDNKEIEQGIINFKRDVDGLLHPEDIRRIRKALGFSQIALANLLGVGAKSFARYETGAVTQGTSMDRLLRVLDAHPEAIQAITPQHGKLLTTSKSVLTSWTTTSASGRKLLPQSKCTTHVARLEKCHFAA